MERLYSEWVRLNEEISRLHELPIFLPTTWITSTILPAIAIITAILTIVYLTAYYYYVNKALPKDSDPVLKSRSCYQITNAIFNTAIGIIGVYQEYWVLPTLKCFQGSSVDRISWNHDELYLVSAMQLAYQVWGLPIGIFYVHESTQMILHHLAVAVSTSYSGFMTTGFRYYTPFFYGMMEISSVPLGIMNSFKDNPSLIQKYPGLYSAIRTTFAISFLLIRVIMCFSRWVPFLRDNFILMYTREMDWFKLYLLVQWSLAAFLEYLQLFWAVLIVKGIIQALSGSGKEKENHDKEKSS